MSTESFYLELPTIEDLLDATDRKNFTQIPDDWYVVITDIVRQRLIGASGYYQLPITR